MEQLRVAVVGCGDFGSYMAGVIAALPCYRICGVCDSDPGQAAEAASRLSVPAFESLNDCLRKSGADAVALFTPNHLHCSQTIEAASLGKHIFCEKPMAITLNECYRMMQAAEQAGVRLMVGHKRRLRPQYKKMAAVAGSGELGRVLSVNITGFHRRDPHGWWREASKGGGLLAFSGVHDIDFLRHLCGEAVNVSARWTNPTHRVSDFEDCISVLMQFQSGAIATLQVSNRYPFQTFRQAFNVQIVLEQGGIWYDPYQFTVHVQTSGEEPQSFAFDNEAGYESAYREELMSFAAWVLDGAEPVLTGWDGLRCVEIMEAARASAYTHNDIALPMSEAGFPVPPIALL
jgi:UDP-N-acetylglucosamine 3-dehydrogenase